jgi:hypothetical protein
MFIAVVAAGFLILGLFSNNSYPSQQARSADHIAKVASNEVIRMPIPAPIKPLLAVPNATVDSINLPRMSVAAGEAVQPTLKAEKRNVETIRPVSMFDDTTGTGDLVKDDDNFDEWAK